jgi:hypothetical protein
MERSGVAVRSPRYRSRPRSSVRSQTRYQDAGDFARVRCEVGDGVLRAIASVSAAPRAAIGRRIQELSLSSAGLASECPSRLTDAPGGARPALVSKDHARVQDRPVRLLPAP